MATKLLEGKVRARWGGAGRVALMAALWHLPLLAGSGAIARTFPEAPLLASPPSDLSGRWFLVEVAATESDLIALGSVKSQVQAALLFDLEHEEGRLSGSGEVCEFRLESPTSLVRVEFPSSFRAALHRPTLNARVEQRGEELLFEQPSVVAVVGAALSRPQGEPLPERADDPRVVDADKDGKPGVTVRVRGLVDGEIYLVQRTWSAMRGRAVSARRIEGLLSHDKEEVVLGATHDVLAAFPPTRPDLEESYFVLERAPASATCADANARMEALLTAR